MLYNIGSWHSKVKYLLFMQQNCSFPDLVCKNKWLISYYCKTLYNTEYEHFQCSFILIIYLNSSKGSL